MPNFLTNKIYKMKKLILTLVTAIAFINVQAQCNSNPISDNGGSGTVNFSDSSAVGRLLNKLLSILFMGLWRWHYINSTKSLSYLWRFI